MLQLRITYMSRSVHDQLPLNGSHAMLLMLRVHLMPGNHQGVHVGDGAAGGQDGVAVGEPDDFPHFCQDGMLHKNEDRSDFVRKHVGVGSCRQPFSGHGDNVKTSGELVEESWMSYWKRKRTIEIWDTLRNFVWPSF